MEASVVGERFLASAMDLRRAIASKIWLVGSGSWILNPLATRGERAGRKQASSHVVEIIICEMTVFQDTHRHGAVRRVSRLEVAEALHGRRVLCCSAER